jgi:hypothetical protein
VLQEVQQQQPSPRQAASRLSHPAACCRQLLRLAASCWHKLQQQEGATSLQQPLLHQLLQQPVAALQGRLGLAVVQEHLAPAVLPGCLEAALQAVGLARLVSALQQQPAAPLCLVDPALLLVAAAAARPAAALQVEAAMQLMR